MRRLVRFGVGFGIAGVIVPIVLLLNWGAWVYKAAPETQLLYRDIAVFLWPTGMSLAGQAMSGFPIAQFAATAVTITENAVMYAVLGLLIAYVWNYFRPEPQKVSTNDEPKAQAASAGNKQA